MAQLLESLHRLDDPFDVDAGDAAVVNEGEDFLEVADAREGTLRRDGVSNWLLGSREQEGEAQLVF
jgi:hypothetical protein